MPKRVNKASEYGRLAAEEEPEGGPSPKPDEPSTAEGTAAPHENGAPAKAAAKPAEGDSGWMVYTGLLGAALGGLLYLRTRQVPGRRSDARKRSATARAAAPARRASLDESFGDIEQAYTAPPPPRAVVRAVDKMPEAEALSVSDFHENVAQLLISVLQREPARSDLRWKLLEAYYFGGHAGPFVEQAQEYKRHLKGKDDEHWESIVRMGRFLAPECPLFGAGEAAAPPQAAKAADAALVAGTNKNRRFHEAIAPQRLRPALANLATAYDALRRDKGFRQALAEEFRHVLGRPTPFAAARFGVPAGMELFLKREDHRGPNDYRLQNAVGQVLLAKKLGAQRVIAGTLSGQHGVAVATAAARRGIACTIHVSDRAFANAEVIGRLKELGAEIQLPRLMFSATAADPRQAALMDWLDNEQSSFFVSGLSGGAAPYPNIVFDLMAVIGEEAALQLRGKTQAPLRLLVASGTGGMETFGLISPFLQDPAVEIYLALQPQADQAKGAARASFAREYNWLEASSRVHQLNVTEAMARAVLKTAEAEHALRLDPADGFTLAGALSLANRVRGNGAGSLVALIGGTPASA